MIGGDWNKVEAIDEGGGSRLPAGGYVARIRNVENVPGKQYLKIEYDIAEGDYRGYYADLFERAKFWGGHFVRSYKQSAAGFFKGFLNAVEASNKVQIVQPNGDVDERQLIGKEVGVVLGEEEYIGNDGSIKTRLSVVKVMASDKIRAGEFTVPEKKKLESVAAPSGGVIDMTAPAAQEIPQDFAQLEAELPF